MKVPVLMYHSICPGDRAPPDAPFSVAEGVLRRQLAYLAREGWRAVSVEDALSPRVRVKDFSITFDDGYVDTYAIAFPALQTLGMVATVFAVSDFSMRRNQWDRGGNSFHKPLLSLQQIREMAAAGVHFGSHGLTHRSLTTLTHDDAVRELIGSKHALEDALGRAVTAFAYPYGHVDEKAKVAVRAAGFASACAVNSGPLDAAADPLEIRRVRMENGIGRPYMALKMTGAEQALRWMLQRAKLAIGKGSL